MILIKHMSIKPGVGNCIRFTKHKEYVLGVQSPLQEVYIVWIAA